MQPKYLYVLIQCEMRLVEFPNGMVKPHFHTGAELGFYGTH